MLVEEDIAKALDSSLHWCDKRLHWKQCKATTVANCIKLPLPFPQGEQKWGSSLFTFRVPLIPKDFHMAQTYFLHTTLLPSTTALRLWKKTFLATDCSTDTPSHLRHTQIYFVTQTELGNKQVAKRKPLRKISLPHKHPYFINELLWQKRRNTETLPLRCLLQWFPGFTPTELKSLWILLLNSIIHLISILYLLSSISNLQRIGMLFLPDASHSLAPFVHLHIEKGGCICNDRHSVLLKP